MKPWKTTRSRLAWGKTWMTVSNNGVNISSLPQTRKLEWYPNQFWHPLETPLSLPENIEMYCGQLPTNYSIQLSTQIAKTGGFIVKRCVTDFHVNSICKVTTSSLAMEVKKVMGVHRWIPLTAKKWQPDNRCRRILTDVVKIEFGTNVWRQS